MRTLAWMLGYAIGYHLGHKDGLRWGRLLGTLETIPLMLGRRGGETPLPPRPRWRGRKI